MIKLFKGKVIFIFIVAVIAIGIVIAGGILHRTISSNNLKASEDCLIDKVSAGTQTCNPQPTVTATPNPTPTYNPNLPNKERFLAAIAPKLPAIPNPGTYEYILLRQYGAVFVNNNPEIKLPPTVVFVSDGETKTYQDTLNKALVKAGNQCYLQKVAADALNQAMIQKRFSLKSGYGSGDCTRTFATNLRFWKKYANNNTLELVRQGKETRILGVVAPPGTSQHLWGLAIDLRVSNSQQRTALNQNGWFQTVENDIPHWTYLGVSESDLIKLGFNQKIVRGITYWLTPL